MPVSTGAYLLAMGIMPYIGRFNPELRVVDLPGDVFPALLKENVAIHGFVSDFAWWDIGKISEYEEIKKISVAELQPFKAGNEEDKRPNQCINPAFRNQIMEICKI
jgi:NDP-sugar pyrophosphorylase family protein